MYKKLKINFMVFILYKLNYFNEIIDFYFYKISLIFINPIF